MCKHVSLAQFLENINNYVILSNIQTQDSHEASLTLRDETLLSSLSSCENHQASRIGILKQLRIFQIVSSFLSYRNNNYNYCYSKSVSKICALPPLRP